MSNLGKHLMAANTYVPTTPGEAWGGGYYVGRMKVDGVSYALVVAPKGSGETTLTIKGNTTANNLGLGRWDGRGNTEAIYNQGVSLGEARPATQWALDLRIGGYSDWAVPARDQLVMLYATFKATADTNYTDEGEIPYADPPRTTKFTASDPAQTSIAAWRSGGSEAMTTRYWSSTDAGPGQSSYLSVDFTKGGHYISPPTNNFGVRAVRLVRI